MSFPLSSRAQISSVKSLAASPARRLRSLRGAASVTVPRADASKAMVPVDQVKDTLGRGFIIVDIRSPEEWQEGSKRTWKKICLAVMDDDGNPELNPYFLSEIKHEFPNTLSRILLVCDDGTMRSEVAHKNITKLGYSQVKIIEGGAEAYFKAFPLTEADKRVWTLEKQAGDDLSVLVSGVDMRQRSEKYY
jgi:rhodanese-related sulfurtransferase